jgi:tetratricopeptide (TPR) repeat protein
MYMADPIISPDGKWMWTGAEWIPAPPSSSQSANVSLQDSVISGDVTITQNNAEDIAVAMVTALERMGFSGQSSPAELTPSQEAEVEQVLEMSEQLASHGIEIDPWTEILLGNAAKFAGRTNTAQQHYLRALETFRKNSDKEGEALSLNNLAVISQLRGDLAEAERLHRESLAINREFGNRQGEALSLNNLGEIARIRSDLAEAERLYRESLAINREFGDREGEAVSLNNLGLIALARGDLAEAGRFSRESLAIRKEIGDREGEAMSLNNLGLIANRRGDPA